MSDANVPVIGLEARAHIGWVCPKCGSSHAPFIASCPVCDASRFPKVQAWLLREVREELDRAENAKEATFTTNHVRALHEAARAKPAP
jgi:uncharacterized OB-fold protein